MLARKLTEVWPVRLPWRAAGLPCFRSVDIKPNVAMCSPLVIPARKQPLTSISAPPPQRNWLEVPCVLVDLKCRLMSRARSGVRSTSKVA
jgi:hypothetical protein